MKKVFRKLAVPPAKELIIEFINISFAPVTLLVIPEKAFLNNKAIETDEPTAAV